MNNPEPVAAPVVQAESVKDVRRAMTRPRATARGYAHRRRATRIQINLPYDLQENPQALLLRRLWEDHAIKAGMALFWGWFLLANWGRIAQQLAA